MGTFGERLQREREMRGITLEEIAEATKIGTRSLRALEQQDFDKLPGGIFNKGFVRAYSKYLGIDEDQSVADYVIAVNEAQAAGKLSRPEHAPPTFEEAEPEKPEPIRIPWGLLIIVALVVAVGFAAKSYYAQYGGAKLRREATPVQSVATPSQQSPAPVAQQPTTTPTPAKQTPVQAPVDTAQKQAIPASTVPENPQTTSGAPADEFVVKIRAKEDARVWIKADGKVVSNGMLPANSERVVRAAKQVILVTENAGGIEVSHNDKLLPPLGAENQKRTVILTPQGIRE